eukprot:824872-Pyramimonas_sp.AAC.1
MCTSTLHCQLSRELRAAPRKRRDTLARNCSIRARTSGGHPARGRVNQQSFGNPDSIESDTDPTETV